MTSTTEFTRLHITPLNPNLLNAIIPPSILPNARNISYHSPQTFPEKAYGFVDLPTMDAEKLKKKLNGSILKGNKIHIEKARPAKDLTPVVEPELPQKPQKERKDPTKKRKRGEETIPAVELRDRKVKRGWTTPAAALGKAKKDSKELKNVVKSKYTTNEECLFKTILPPNVAAGNKSSGDSKSSRKSKKGKDAVVHEFQKSTKFATFLRSSTGGEKAKVASEFVDGKGWVDEDGNVIEEVIKKVRNSQEPQKVEKSKQAEIINKASGISEKDSSSEEDSSSDESEDEKVGSKDVSDMKEAKDSSSSSESDSSSEDDSSSDEDETHEASQRAPKLFLEAKAEKDNARKSKSENPSVDSSSDAEPSVDEVSNQESQSSSDSSSDSSDSESESESNPIERTTLEPISKEDITSVESNNLPPILNTTAESKTSRPPSSSSLSIVIPDSVMHATTVSTEVHPLEALYKRPKPDDSISQPETKTTSFSFFEPDDDEDDQDQESYPLTPFSKKDFEYRGIRSAAPTPDTAHANKRFTWPGSKDDEDEGENEDMEDSPTRYESTSKDASKSKQDTSGGTAAESDFQKWFYEHRGENTRGWKKRRKTVAKEQRHRENKKSRRS